MARQQDERRSEVYFSASGAQYLPNESFVPALPEQVLTNGQVYETIPVQTKEVPNMKLKFEHRKYGHAFGIWYGFECAGDYLPAHNHTWATAHIVIVLKGKVRFEDCASGEDTYLQTGDMFSFDWTRQHKIEAMLPDTEIFNLFLYGQPVGYEELPDHEKKGTLELS